MTKPPKNRHADHDYQQGYEQGVWDTENRIGQDIESALEAKAKTDTQALVLESIACQVVAYFGDLATTLAELRDLRPQEVDVLKRVTRDVRTPTASAVWSERETGICEWCEGGL